MAKLTPSGIGRRIGSLLLLGTLAACTSSAPGEDAGAACPQDLPAACQPNPPSYRRDIEPILRTRCLECHDQGTTKSRFEFTSYAQVYAARSGILNQVYRCAMPPSPQPRLDAEERAALLNWLVCRAPDN